MLTVPELYFGGFQALMPLLGLFSGLSALQSFITAYDHWIAFVLLGADRRQYDPRGAAQGEDEEAHRSARISASA